MRIGRTKHPYCGHKLYRVWAGMKTRCTNKNHKSYKDYGGRGIKVCAEWNVNFISSKEK